MLNSESQARTVADSSNTVEQHPSSPNNAKPYVGGSFRPVDKNNNNIFDGDNVKLKWYHKILLYPLKLIIEVIITGIANKIEHRNRIEKSYKNKLRFFNPIIKKNVWGNEYIEWVGRDKPLTYEEIEKLWKSS